MDEIAVGFDSAETAECLNGIVGCVRERECCFIVIDCAGSTDGDANDVIEHSSMDIWKLESDLKRSALTFYRIEGVPAKTTSLICNNA